MKRLMTVFFVFIFIIGVCAFFACRSRSIGFPAAELTNMPTPAATQTLTPTNTPRLISGMIDDFSDCDGNNVFSGPWFCYGDSNNTFTNPPPVISPGYNGNNCAIKFEGQAAALCGYGVWMSNSLLGGPVSDLSRNTAISFYAKGSGSYRIVLISSLTQYNDYQYTFTAQSSWTQITIPFTSFTQPNNFNTAPINQALQKITNISWANGSCNMTIDLTVDELQVY